MKDTVDLRTCPRGCTDPSMGRLLAAYEWGLLGKHERDGFEEHLVSCDACSAELLATAHVGAAMRASRVHPSRAWVPLAATAAAAAVFALFSVMEGQHREAPVPVVETDPASAAVQEATFTFELNVPRMARFSYDLSVPGSG